MRYCMLIVPPGNVMCVYCVFRRTAGGGGPAGGVSLGRSNPGRAPAGGALGVLCPPEDYFSVSIVYRTLGGPAEGVSWRCKRQRPILCLLCIEPREGPRWRGALGVPLGRIRKCCVFIVSPGGLLFCVYCVPDPGGGPAEGASWRCKRQRPTLCLLCIEPRGGPRWRGAPGIPWGRIRTCCVFIVPPPEIYFVSIVYRILRGGPVGAALLGLASPWEGPGGIMYLLCPRRGSVVCLPIVPRTLGAVPLAGRLLWPIGQKEPRNIIYLLFPGRGSIVYRTLGEVPLKRRAGPVPLGEYPRRDEKSYNSLPLPSNTERTMIFQVRTSILAGRTRYCRLP